MTSRRAQDINKGFSKYDALKNDVVGTKFYIIVLDIAGQIHYLNNTIKAYRPGSLIIVEEWNGDAANLNLPCRFFPKAEYHLNPSRALEKMTSDVRMFGRDKDKLLKEWVSAWNNKLNAANNLVNKFQYLIWNVADCFTNSEE